MKESATRSASPIFIGGMMRSGTTLLRAMLGQHSAIASGLETYWFDWDWPNRDRAEVAGRIERLAVFFDMPLPGVRALAAECASAEAFLDHLMMASAAAAGKRRWAEKTPGNVAVMPRILAFWPDARIVHIRRDPKDVYASLRKSGKAGGPEAFAERWCAVVGGAECDKPALGARLDGSYTELLYEALVTAPEAVMRPLLAFLGEPWEAGVARFAGKPDEFDKVLQVTGKRSDVLDRLARPLGDESVGAWRREVPAEEIAALRRAVAQRGHGALFAGIEAAAEVAAGALPAHGAA
jgi:hypothetical protein